MEIFVQSIVGSEFTTYTKSHKSDWGRSSALEERSRLLRSVDDIKSSSDIHLSNPFHF